MKLNENFILKTIAGSPVVVPVGDAIKNIHGMITLNGVAEIIWKSLEKGMSFDEIVAVIKTEYDDVSQDVVEADVKAFLAKLEEYGILER